MPAYIVDLSPRETDQVFSYHHGDKMLHFNASLLARLHKAMPREFRRITIDLTTDEYDLCMKHRGIEEPRVEALTATSLREPGYAVIFDNGLFTIIDGHHRLVRRYRGDVRVMDFWVTHADVWQHCLVPYGPEEEALLNVPPRVTDTTEVASRVTLHPRKNK